MGNNTPTEPVPSKAAGWVAALDRLINLLKWPVAVLAVLVTPILCWSALMLLARMIQTPSWSLIPFACGVALFIVVWQKSVGNWSIGRWLVTMEHEVTHAIFAFLTGHKIVSIRATIGSGGEVQYAGNGNWLITAAPYFFPTAAILLSVIAFFLPFSGLPWGSFLLGVALGYHFVSTYRETHGEQSDLKQLGKTFSWMFLPAANIATVLFLIAYAHNASDGVRLWLADLRQPIGLIIGVLQDIWQS